MMYGVTSSEQYKDGVNLIAENHNLKRELEEVREELAIYKEFFLEQMREQRAEEERAKREKEERKQRELEEAIAYKEQFMYRDYEHDPYLSKIYGRKARPGQRHEWR